MASGRSKSRSRPQGFRRVEAATGKRLSPRSLRPKRKYLEDCTDEELEKLGIDREKRSTQSTGYY